MISDETDQDSKQKVVFVSEKPLFELGQLLMTPGVNDAIDIGTRIYALVQHSAGNWGDVVEEDKQANDEAVENDGRIFSAYSSNDGTKFWVITEADRSSTTLLLPSEY